MLDLRREMSRAHAGMNEFSFLARHPSPCVVLEREKKNISIYNWIQNLGQFRLVRAMAIPRDGSAASGLSLSFYFI